MPKRRRMVRLRPRHLLASGLMAFLAAACTGGGDDNLRVEERDGVTWVESVGPGAWAELDPLPVEFVLEQTFGADSDPPEAILGRIRAIAVDGDANVYMIDSQTSLLTSFSPDGTVRWQAGGAGEGPGELNRASGMVWGGADNLYVLDDSGTKLDRWTLDGAYQVSHPLQEIDARGLGIAGLLSPTVMVLSGPKWGAIGTEITVIELDEPLRKMADFSVDLYPDLEMPESLSSGPVVRTLDDWIAVGHQGRYELSLYNRDGELVRVIARPDADYLVRAGFATGNSGSLIAGFGTLYPPLRLPSGHLLVTANWVEGIDDPDVAARRLLAREEVERRYSSSIDLFDEEGRFLVSLVTDGELTPEIGRPTMVGPDGRLYTIATEPFPQVRRYRVAFD